MSRERELSLICGAAALNLTLAGLCFWLWRATPPSTPMSPAAPASIDIVGGGADGGGGSIGVAAPGDDERLVKGGGS